MNHDDHTQLATPALHGWVRWCDEATRLRNLALFEPNQLERNRLHDQADEALRKAAESPDAAFYRAGQGSGQGATKGASGRRP